MTEQEIDFIREHPVEAAGTIERLEAENAQLRKMLDLGITPQDVAETLPPGMPGSDDPHAALVFARHRQQQGLV